VFDGLFWSPPVTIVALGILALAATAPACPARATGERLEKVASKGVELYSWKDAKGDFRYSLLWGTNRNKAESEIKASGCVLANLEALKSALGHLAIGEQVFWANSMCPKKACAYPADSVKQDLSARAHTLGIVIEQQ